MSEHSDAVLEECGLNIETAAASLANVFRMVTEPGKEAQGELAKGWVAAAVKASVMFTESEENEITLTWVQFATMLRTAYARTVDPEMDVPQFDQLPLVVRAGWETVARHASNIFNLERREATRLDSHEQRVVEMCLARLPKP